MDCPRVRYPQLNDVVEADLAEQGYQVLTDAGQQVDKVIQLYEVPEPVETEVLHVTCPCFQCSRLSQARTLACDAYILFGSVTCAFALFDLLVANVHMLGNETNYQLKTIAASQVLMTRHTVMVVGQTGGGKSVILQTLARAQTKMGKRTTMSTLNPKVTLALRPLFVTPVTSTRSVCRFART